MKHALQKPVDGKPSKRAPINPKSTGQKQLQDFVTANTKRFFEILEVPCTFLEKDAEEWNDDESYANARYIAYGLKVWKTDSYGLKRCGKRRTTDGEIQQADNL
ncbi:Hypothetical predicted protein [Octopus vulgaris]|uniref:Uncharacterized protein n=1 Tax=Octopus vulgaris TaxID=6645 RepID=A0AA36AUK3_OCTVU|nr:Hypothetical predicted protein [Octopus vulgaris]